MKTVSRMLVGLTLLLAGPASASNAGAPILPVLWTAGGLDSGAFGGGQAARLASDPAGNVAVVSGPSGTDMVVTSYTPDGVLRWRSKISPSTGTFRGDWVAAAPNGDFVAVGRNYTASGNPIAITVARFRSDGALAWRVSVPGLSPRVARLLVDSQGSAYLAFSAVGDGLDIQVRKYDATGVLLWSSQPLGTGFMANDLATSLALGPDESDVVVSGEITGGSTWITAAFDAATGVRRWLATQGEGTAARDVVVDDTQVYVTGQTATGAGTPALRYFLTVIAYDRATGARRWRTDQSPADGSYAMGLRMAKAPDGSLVATGQVNRGFLDWYTVALETTGAVRWEAVRDGGLNTNEIPSAVLVTADGTTVVTGQGGPNLPGGFIPGVAAGYSPSGILLWEAFARMVTAWAIELPSGDVCATGGYDALVTCWRPSALGNQPPRAVLSASPSVGPPPLAVAFDGSASFDLDGTVTSWAWSFGDGASATGPLATHVYAAAGTFTASLTVTDNQGATDTATRSIIVGFPPAAPSNLVASIAGALVVLTWQDNSPDETAFQIERCEGSGCTAFAPLAEMPANFTGFTDYSVPAGASLGYRVRARGPTGYSAYSNIARAVTPGPPAAPTNLTAAALNRTTIALTWTNRTADQTGVTIERCAGAGCTNFIQVASLAGTATAYTDSRLAARTTYRYRVQAHNALGDSAYSNIASARTRR